MDEGRAHFHLACTPNLRWIAPPLEKEPKRSYALRRSLNFHTTYLVTLGTFYLVSKVQLIDALAGSCRQQYY
jgi:hypothetical protein